MISRADRSHAIWRKSSLSNANGGACVEVASNLLGVVYVRDSKDAVGPILVVPADHWRAFVTSLRSGHAPAN